VLRDVLYGRTDILLLANVNGGSIDLDPRESTHHPWLTSLLLDEGR
jgi:hypothetical protein